MDSSKTDKMNDMSHFGREHDVSVLGEVGRLLRAKLCKRATPPLKNSPVIRQHFQYAGSRSDRVQKAIALYAAR